MKYDETSTLGHYNIIQGESKTYAFYSNIELLYRLFCESSLFS